MIKALLVDDESVLRKGLLKHIHWEELGVDEIRDVGSAREGIEVAAGYHPDIVITDVLMPAMDGITFGRYIRQSFPSCKLIYISGYAEKPYLKAAIDLNAVSFVEKPIEIDVIQQAIRKAVSLSVEETAQKINDKNRCELISENVRIIKQDIVNSLLSREKNIGRLTKYLNTLDIRLDPDAFYSVVMLRLYPPAELPAEVYPCVRGKLLEALDRALNGAPHLCGEKDSWQIAAILPADENDFRAKAQALRAAIQDQARELAASGFRLYCAAGSPAAGIAYACESAFAAETGLARAQFLDDDQVIFSCEEAGRPCRVDCEFLRAFSKLLQGGDERKAQALLEQGTQQMREQGGPVRGMRDLFFHLALELWHTSEREGLRLYGEEENQEICIRNDLLVLRTFEELKAELMSKTRTLFELKRERQAGGGVVVEVMRAIQERYADSELSAKALADSVYLTPNYLSFLFKKETGQTISEYITQTRITRAQELLFNNKLKLYEVARSVGFTDANYFAKTYKKVAGTNPSQNRGRTQNG